MHSIAYLREQKLLVKLAWNGRGKPTMHIMERWEASIINWWGGASSSNMALATLYITQSFTDDASFASSTARLGRFQSQVSVEFRCKTTGFSLDATG